MTRTAVLEGPPPSEVVLFGLPLGLLDDSVRVSARGAVATMAIITLEVPDALGELPPSEATDVRGARRAAALATAEVTRLRAELDALERAPLLTEPVEQQAPAPWAQVAAARRELASFRQRRHGELSLALVEAQRQARDCERALTAAVESDARRSTARAPRTAELRKAVRIALTAEPANQAEAGTSIELSLEYAVLGARWVPSYVARLADGRVELTMRAQLLQRTGEDWLGVDLQLSTAALDRPGELPELTALKLGKRQPAPPARYRPPPQGVDELFSDFTRQLAPSTPPSPPPAAGRHADLDQTRPMPLMSAAAMPAAALPTGPMGGFGAQAMMARDEDEVTEVEPQRRRGAPRPAEPMSPPMQRKSANVVPRALLGSASAGGGPGGPPPAKAGLSRAAAPAEFAEPERASGFQRVLARPAIPTALVAQLDFHSLMMAGVDHPLRGQLVAMSLAVRYQLGETASAGLDATALQQRLAGAQRIAERVDSAALPPGTSDAWSHDFDYALAAQGRLDVPSDGSWHSLPLGTRDTPARVQHVAVPREQDDVFRIATTENPFEAPLLPGPVDVYDGNRFLVTAPLPMVAPGGELVLPLGVDAQIKIARQTEYREEVTGMLRGGLRLLHDLRIEVQNNSPAAIDLEIRERVPVPREQDSDDITVKVTASKPPWQPWTPPLASPLDPPLRGGYAWRLAVAARSPATLTASYEIQIAGKHELVDGNRREP